MDLSGLNFNSLEDKTVGVNIMPTVSSIPDFREFPKWDGDYYNLKALSNSFMQNIYHEQNDFFEVDEKFKVNALRFGTVFHEYILEKKEQGFNRLTFAEIETIKSMEKSLIKASREDFVIKSFVHIVGKVEHEYYRKMKGFYCKCKCDKVCSDTIFELKSTSAKTKKAFSKSIERFGYDRAASFYLDVSKKRNHYIIAVSKVAPYHVFTHVTIKDSINYIKGRNKYLDIMNIILDIYKNEAA